MKSITHNHLRILFWFFKRPGLYPELLRRIKKSWSSSSSLQTNTQEDARLWCDERAIDTSNAIAKIIGTPPAEPIREKYSDVFARADETVKSCPVGMGGGANIDLLYSLAEYLKAKSVIETGVGYGWSSLAILLSLTKRDNTMLVSTDKPFTNRNSEPYIGCVVPPELRANWKIVKRADREALPKALKRLPTIDLCHYDSDKSYEGRRWAYPRLWEALRVGGCFISDDVGDNLAFHDFCIEINVKPIIVRTEWAPIFTGVKYVGVLIKDFVRPKTVNDI